MKPVSALKLICDRNHLLCSDWFVGRFFASGYIPPAVGVAFWLYRPCCVSLGICLGPCGVSGSSGGRPFQAALASCSGDLLGRLRLFAGDAPCPDQSSLPVLPPSALASVLPTSSSDPAQPAGIVTAGPCSVVESFPSQRPISPWMVSFASPLRASLGVGGSSFGSFGTDPSMCWDDDAALGRELPLGG